MGIATNHGGFGLKKDLHSKLKAPGHAVADFGVRPALMHVQFWAKQVEDDHINIPCTGWRTVGPLAAWDFVETFLNAKFRQEPRHLGPLGKVTRTEAEKLLLVLERKSGGSLCVQR